MIIILNDPELNFHFGSERSTSHPDENYFGQYRTHFFGNYRLLTAFRFAVRSSLALDFQNDLGVSFQIPKRSNVSGAHLNFVNNENKRFDIYSIPDEKIFSENIQKVATDLFNVGTGEKQIFDDETINFLESLFSFFKKFSSCRKESYSLVKGSDIFPRIVFNQLNTNKEKNTDNSNECKEEEESGNDENNSKNDVRINNEGERNEEEEEDDDKNEEEDEDEEEEEADDDYDVRENEEEQREDEKDY